jgi:hypothetical protein
VALTIGDHGSFYERIFFMSDKNRFRGDEFEPRQPFCFLEQEGMDHVQRDLVIEAHGRAAPGDKVFGSRSGFVADLIPGFLVGEDDLPHLQLADEVETALVDDDHLRLIACPNPSIGELCTGRVIQRESFLFLFSVPVALLVGPVLGEVTRHSRIPSC